MPLLGLQRWRKASRTPEAHVPPVKLTPRSYQRGEALRASDNNMQYGKNLRCNTERSLSYKGLIFKEIKDSLDAILWRTANDVALFNPSIACQAQVFRPAGLAHLAPRPPSLPASLHEPPTGPSPPLSTALTSPPEGKAQLESNFERRVRITPDPQKRKFAGTKNPYRLQIRLMSVSPESPTLTSKWWCEEAGPLG